MSAPASDMATQETSEPQLILYDHPVSSYAQKVRIALREKAIPFKSVVPFDLTNPQFDSQNPAPPPISKAINLGNGPLATANPRAEVPALLLGPSATPVFDSTIILEYLEDAFPNPPLLPAASPASASARAAARMVEDVCDTAYEAINWGLGELTWMKRAKGKPELEESMKAEAARQTEEIYAWLEEKLVRAGGQWFGGEFGFGWGDVCVAPYVNRSVYYGLGPKAGTKLVEWFERVKERPSVKETFSEFNGAVGGMGAMVGVFERGERRRQYRDYRLEWMVKSGGAEIVLEGMQKGNVRFGWP